MGNLANIKPSRELATLIAKAQLSNQVSVNALKTAQKLWGEYVQTSNRRRRPQAVLAVANELRLVITQVASRETRINPVMWHKLVTLEANLRQAVAQGVNLEPRLNTAAANDDVEVA